MTPSQAVWMKWDRDIAAACGHGYTSLRAPDLARPATWVVHGVA
ncbi:hypothetical protein [Komagataeibacter europaeus]|nr:hypothetical protein [Komagataeibacter europaeus]